MTDRLLLRLGLAREADRLRGLTVVVSREGVVRRVKWDCSLLAPTARGFKDEVQHKWPARDPPRAENA
ncbi:MAG: hypothetical protein QN197_12540 [Armatimonadota bacterium]|nr:hypothetical protein [Armatimonadota bacterium]